MNNWIDTYLVDIALIKSNSIVYDSRVRKIARSLGKKYSLVTLGWNRDAIPIGETKSDFHELRLFNLKAPIGKATLVLYLPIFWVWILFRLSVCRPDVVHACDLDTLPPSYIYKVLFGKKLVFDVFDRLGMAYLPQKFKLLRTLVDSLEEWFAIRSDVLILTSERFLSSFRKKPKLCALILNCPEDYTVKKTRVHDNLLTLVYTGNIVRKRGLEKVTEAMKNLEGVELVIAGRILDKDFLDEILRLSNVIYKGLLSPIDALELEGDSDVLISLYDLSVPNYNLAISNKTFEAMMFGLPVITNIALELIDEVGCGIKVEYDDLDQVKSAIISLRDNDELRKKLGANGRMAFETKYNWSRMEQELYRIYDGLLNK